MPGKGQSFLFSLILLVILDLPRFSMSLHPKLNLQRMTELFKNYGGESKASIEALVHNVNHYHYCSNKIHAAKKWAKNRSKSSDEGFDLVVYVEAMCIANEYTMGQVYPALRENGPLNVQTLDELKNNYTRDYAEKYGSDAMYAFTWFTIDYMKLLNYEENALSQTNEALTRVKQRFSPESLAEVDLLKAYRILMWDRLYSTYPPGENETGIFIFNRTMEHIFEYWRLEDQTGDRK